LIQWNIKNIDSNEIKLKNLGELEVVTWYFRFLVWTLENFWKLNYVWKEIEFKWKKEGLKDIWNLKKVWGDFYLYIPQKNSDELIKKINEKIKKWELKIWWELKIKINDSEGKGILKFN